MDRENYEKEFYLEVKGKKDIGRNARYRASRKKGFKGGMITAFDLLSKKEQNQLMKGSEVRLTIINRAEFSKLDREKQETLIESLIQKYPRKFICDEWGISLSAFNSILYRLRGGSKKPVNIVEDKEIKPMEQTNNQTNSHDKVVSKKVYTFQVSLDGEFDGEELANRLSGMALLLEKGKKYEVGVVFKEIR